MLRYAKTLLYCSFFSLCCGFPPAARAQPADRARVLVLTDIEADPDDSQSLVRFLTYANQWDIEGLVATTSIHQKTRVVSR